MLPWTPSGIVTLTTDFGLEDPYVGVMKGVLYSRLRSVTIVDIAHGVPPQDVRTGGFFLAHACAYFPPGTVHLAVVDPGVGTARALLVAEDQGQAFLAPDNGLLESVLSTAARVHELDVQRFAAPHASATFHGRDILAPAAAAIAGGLAPERAGRQLRAFLPLERRRPAWVGYEMVIEILAADRYGNLILDARPEDLEPHMDRVRVVAGGYDIEFGRTYGDVRSGELLALVDSYGYVELAVRDGSAADRLGLQPGQRVLVRRRS